MEVVPSMVRRFGFVLDLNGRKIVLQEFLGVHQPGTCDSRSCLAPASYGRRAALLSHFLLAVLRPPGVMPTRRPISCSVMALIGALAPSGSSPATRMLATMWSREQYCGGEGSGLDCLSYVYSKVLAVKE
jgi:hypothetical protein